MKKSIGSGRGSVYNIILKALQSGDKYGYEICKEVEDKTNGAYILKQPSLYSGLKRLEAQGDVKSYWKDSALGGRRHYYSLTESGKSRIESSDFNWQDARDDIVDNLFEKSELEKTIESAESDLNYIKANALNNQTQQDIDDIINSTEYLTKQNEEQSFDAKADEVAESYSEEIEQENKNDEQETVDYSAGDLFSMFNTVGENEEIEDDANIQAEPETENVNMEEMPESLEESDAKNTDEAELKTAEIETKDLSDEDKVIENQETYEEKEDKQLDLFSFFNNSQTYKQNIAKNGQDSLEENTDYTENESEKPVNNEFSDIENNLKTVKEEVLENDKIEVEHNNLLEENVIDQTEDLTDDELNLIFENVKDEDEVPDTTLSNQTETEEKFEEEVVLEKDGNDVFEEHHANNISFDANTDNSNDELKNLSNEIQEHEVDDNSNEKIDDGLKTEVVQEKSSVDYKNIFGDLISQQPVELDKNAEIDDEFVYNNTNSNDLNQENANETVVTEQKSTLQDKINEELPRNDDAIKDINRTLMFDTTPKKQETYNSNNFEKYDQTPFMEGNGFGEEKQQNNPFEKYDTYQKIDDVKYQNNSKKEPSYDYQNERISNLSFDKKYANAYNKFEVPDYEVRYFRKNNVQNSASKFISINRLNLVNSFILSLLMCIATTICLIISTAKSSMSGFQMFVYVLSYLICFSTLIVNFFKYHFNKNKKVQKIKKPESMYLSFIAIVMITLSIAINLLAGMSFDNIAGYLASFILPMFYACVLLINYPLKKFLSKFASFYN